MLTFRSFIFEEVNDNPNKVGGVSNNTKGVLHEILTGYHLNGGKHMEKHVNKEGETPEQTHNRLKQQIHPKDYERINARAKSAANDIRKNIEANHPGHSIVAVTHTSKPGDTEKVTGVKASQKQDSSDIYVSTQNKKKKESLHHGFSLKVSDNPTKKLPSSSLGVESSGSNTPKLHAKHKEEILSSYPELKGKNAGERKAWAKANPEKHAKIREKNRSLLASVAQSHAEELQNNLKNGNHEAVISHIRNVLHAHQTPAEQAGKGTFNKHTTYEAAKGTQHETSQPGQSFEHILNDHKNITVRASGGSVHFYHKGKKFASQAHKFNSQSDPLSSIKSAGREA